MKRESTDYIIVHCSATPPEMDIGAEEIRGWHLDRGWKDIGYHYVIRRDGQVESGRPTGDVGAHAKGFNRSSIGICLVGGLKAGQGRHTRGRDQEPDANFTAAQYDALEALVEGLMGRGGHNYGHKLAVIGHRDLPGVTKACPCFDVPAWWSGR